MFLSVSSYFNNLSDKTKANWQNFSWGDFKKKHLIDDDPYHDPSNPYHAVMTIARRTGWDPVDIARELQNWEDAGVDFNQRRIEWMTELLINTDRFSLHKSGNEYVLTPSQPE